MPEEKNAIKLLRKAIMDKLGIYRQILNHRITQKISSISFGITREQALIMVAIDEKISLDLISQEKIDEVNDILFKIKQADASVKSKDITQSSSTTAQKVTKVKKQQSKKRSIIIDFSDFRLAKSNLPKSKILEAHEMAEFYAYLYVFENSVREFIIEVMEDNYDADWWDSEVSNRIKRDVDQIIRKEKGKWVLREAHPIFYTTMKQLVAIIEKNWDDFKLIFGDVQKLKTLIEPIEEARNPIAHNNALTKDSRELLKLNIKMWFNYIEQIS